MQINPASIWYLAIGFVVSIAVWIIFVLYKERGMDLLRLLARGKITEPSGLGSWYANNITGYASAIVYSIAHFGPTLLSLWFTVLMLAPLEFPALLDATWMALPLFLALGFMVGIDIRYRCLGIVDPDSDEEDGS